MAAVFTVICTVICTENITSSDWSVCFGGDGLWTRLCEVGLSWSSRTSCLKGVTLPEWRWWAGLPLLLPLLLLPLLLSPSLLLSLWKLELCCWLPWRQVWSELSGSRPSWPEPSAASPSSDRSVPAAPAARQAGAGPRQWEVWPFQWEAGPLIWGERQQFWAEQMRKSRKRRMMRAEKAPGWLKKLLALHSHTVDC